jgi:hypothetical protein
MLSSVTMQRCPTVLVAFASFNEQLIPSLLNACSPSSLIIINGRPPHLHWREKATQEIVSPLIREYRNDNPVDADGLMLLATSTLDYRETFERLAHIYRENAYSNRLVIAPTGSKMQAVACALLKNCCEDVHVEYPTPESFFVRGFSSERVVAIHELRFDSFCDEVYEYRRLYGLDGQDRPGNREA